MDGVPMPDDSSAGDAPWPSPPVKAAAAERAALPRALAADSTPPPDRTTARRWLRSAVSGLAKNCSGVVLPDAEDMAGEDARCGSDTVLGVGLLRLRFLPPLSAGDAEEPLNGDTWDRGGAIPASRDGLDTVNTCLTIKELGRATPAGAGWRPAMWW